MTLLLLLLLTSSHYLHASVWISGSRQVHFYEPITTQLLHVDLPAEEAFLEKKTCHLWNKKENSFVKLNTAAKVVCQISTSDHLLGELGNDGIFLTFNSQMWNVRNPDGTIITSFPSLASDPVEIQGSLENGFFTLDYQKDKNHLALVHFTETGKIIWKKIISEKTELWNTPSLRVDLDSQLIWVGFSISTSEHVYSPRLELWNASGEKIVTYQSKDRGLFLGACLKAKGELITARDLPSSPYSVPLFSFLDLFTSQLVSNRIHTLEQNWLISSLECNENATWFLQKTLFGGQNSQLVEWSSLSGEKIHLDFEEPTWKIHLCSLK